MKKELGLFVTLLAIGTLAGCNNQKDQETSQASTAETTATTMVESTQTQKSSQLHRLVRRFLRILQIRVAPQTSIAKYKRYSLILSCQRTFRLLRVKC